MNLIDLYKSIEEEKEYKLIAAFVHTDITNNIIKYLKELSIKYKYKYKEYIPNKTNRIIKEIQIN